MCNVAPFLLPSFAFSFTRQTHAASSFLSRFALQFFGYSFAAHFIYIILLKILLLGTFNVISSIKAFYFSVTTEGERGYQKLRIRLDMAEEYIT